jgi:beta-glucosidase
MKKIKAIMIAAGLCAVCAALVCVVQLYVKHSDTKVAWPNEELKGFQRVRLQPGETKTVKMPLAAKSLAYFAEAQGQFVVLEEPVTLRIGSSSADIRLEQKVAVAAAK